MFYDNLKAACKARGTSIGAVLEQMGKASGSSTSWKSGAIPRLSVVIALAKELDVSVDFLALGEDSKNQVLVDEEIELINAFRQLPHDDRIRILERTKAISEQSSTSDNSKSIEIKAARSTNDKKKTQNEIQEERLNKFRNYPEIKNDNDIK